MSGMPLPPPRQQQPPPSNPVDAPQLDIEDAILLDSAESRLTAFLRASGNDLHRAGDNLVDSYNGTPDMIRLLLHWAKPMAEDVVPFLCHATLAAVKDKEEKFISAMDGLLTSTDASLPEVVAVTRSKQWNSAFTTIAARHPTSALRIALSRENRLSAADIDKTALRDPTAFCDEFAAMLTSAMASRDADLPICADFLEEGPDAGPLPRDGHDAFLNRFAELCTFDECTTKAALYMLARLSRESEQFLSRNFFRRLSQHVRRHAVRAIVDVCAPSSSNGSVDDNDDENDDDSPPALPLDADDLGVEVSETTAAALSHITQMAIVADGVAAGTTVRSSLVDALLVVAMNRGDTDGSSFGREARARVGSAARVMTAVFGTVFLGIVTTGGCAVADKKDVPDDFKLEPITFTEKAVLLRAVCHDEVVRQLFDAAFSVRRLPQRNATMAPEKRRCLCLLLAFAGTFLTTEDAQMEDLLRNQPRAAAMCTAVSALFQRVEALASTCESLKPGCPRYMLKPEATKRLVDACKDGFLARGVAIWARESLIGGENLRDLFNTAGAHLAFLTLVARHNIALRVEVVASIRDALVRDYGELVDTEVAALHKQYMKSLIGLMRLHVGVEIVTMMATDVAKSPRVDVSLLRMFLLETLKMVKPPYSKGFARATTMLLKVPRILRASAKSTDEVTRLVDKFRMEANKMDIQTIS